MNELLGSMTVVDAESMSEFVRFQMRNYIFPKCFPIAARDAGI
jgi:hypothetical protein